MGVYRGVIFTDKDTTGEEKKFLDEIGVKTGEYNDKWELENCEVSEEAMTRLDPHWGRFYWSLDFHET